MKRLSLGVFYELGKQLGAINLTTGASGAEVLMACMIPHGWILKFLQETSDLADVLEESRQAAMAVNESMRPWIDMTPDVLVKPLDVYANSSMQAAIKKFEEAFDRDHRKIDVFLVTGKGIYNTRLLIERPEEKFSSEVRAVLPDQTRADLRQAGKCLAFEVPTACAFHICRATEALMIRYYRELTGEDWAFSKRDWKIYIDQLGANGAPKAITTRLDEIRAMDRNSYAHPDVNVSLDEAPIVFELCTGVIFQIAKEIIRLRNAAAGNP